ncbi:MAG TPA: Asp-tRNA(Asn)/Glu-tRNA(Gln) amidotransferase subunit GatB [Ignavibacteria bacterium]|nr:Asp-tRNA(Asn)/Glu-tRNA(Gln) amidotransferase subunit GatB [Ignavibacteria bacterium]HMQ98727.1 Asp-tRNA(Asn)/Glu-tRNA(Gln) amidotransferase subunit GatB [Ignavibacteria bacterium]
MENIFSKYEPVIGLEVHAQLKTKSKAFCSCSTEFNAPPNTNVCPVCLGHPGTLPVLNRNLVEFILRLGTATNCSIRTRSIFARKNYFYPDLPKGYQISQFDQPICEHGKVAIGDKTIGITRIHMEEDAGKSIHDMSTDESLVDLNRCGVPLIEIVSEPDIRDSKEAYDYLTMLKQLVIYLDICDGNMEEGSLRCDANVSVRLKGAEKFGTKCEVKNLNSFRNVADALDYEIKRQIELIEKGGEVTHQTMTFDARNKATIPMRSKEEAHDYRYFPEPDLVTVYVDEKWKQEISSSLPELPHIKTKRFIIEYNLPEYDAEVLTQSRELADYFESVCKLIDKQSYKTASNWVMGEVMRVLNEKKITISGFNISGQNLAALVKLIADGRISNNIAREVYSEMLMTDGPEDTKQDPEKIVKDKNLLLVTDTTEIEEIVKKIIADNPKEAERFRAGETKLLGLFVGKVMKESKGKANPKTVNELITKNLGNN